MDLIDHAPLAMTGRFALAILCSRTGAVLETMEEPNLVVSRARQVVALLVGGTNDPISTIGFGTNGAAPVVGNTALTGAFTKPVGAVSFPTPSSVRWAFTLASGEANGISIAEFGLLSASGLLFARKVRAAPLAKTNLISLSGSWTLNF